MSRYLYFNIKLSYILILLSISRPGNRIFPRNMFGLLLPKTTIEGLIVTGFLSIHQVLTALLFYLVKPTAGGGGWWAWPLCYGWVLWFDLIWFDLIWYDLSCRRRPFPMQLNQQAKPTHLAKSPQLFNPKWDFCLLRFRILKIFLTMSILWLKAQSPTVWAWRRRKDILTKGNSLNEWQRCL